MSLRLELRGTVLVATLDRPEALNAIDAVTRGAVIAAMRRVNADPAIRAVVLTGAGDRAFTAGQDLAELADLDAAAGAAWVWSLGSLYQALRDLDKPSVVALNGLASGAGLQLALHADICIGHPGVTMGQKELDAGLPSVLGPWIMRETMGLGRAQWLSLSSRFADADECVRYGMIDALVPAERVLDEAVARAEALGAKPPLAMALSKRRFREVTQASWDATLTHAASLAALAFGTGAPQRTAAAFLARKNKT